MEKAQIILIEKPDIVDAVFEHGDPLYSHAEGKAGILLRIVTDCLEYLGVNHTRSQNLQPSPP